MTFDVQGSNPPGAKIKVIGVGGGGNNAVNTMIRSELEGVEFIAANTDIQSLSSSLATIKVQVGKELTKGLGAGADPDVGRDAALEDRHELQEVLGDADMVFITAGMGGGTGTGGASIVAQIAREMGALTVAVVTKPFIFEGKRRARHAEMGIARLRESVDTLITIPNQRLLQIATPDLSMVDAFKMADSVLVNAVKGISDIINVPGTVNVDFADVKTVMSCMGQALMGIGVATGPNRAVEAAHQAISSPLLEDIDIDGATGILINITAGSGVTLMEVNEACSIVQEAAHEDANIIFGAVIDETMGDAIRVTVIATGFPVEMDGQMSASTMQTQRKTIVEPFARSKIFVPSTLARSTQLPPHRRPVMPMGTPATATTPVAPRTVISPDLKHAVPARTVEAPKSDPWTQAYPPVAPTMELPVETVVAAPVAAPVPVIPAPQVVAAAPVIAAPVSEPVIADSLPAFEPSVFDEPMAVQQETILDDAQELAQFTADSATASIIDELSDFGGFADAPIAEATQETPVAAAAETTTFEPSVSFDHPVTQQASEEVEAVQVEAALDVAQPAAVNLDSDILFFSDEPVTPSVRMEIPSVQKAGATARDIPARSPTVSSSQAPLESFFGAEDPGFDDIDRKIDEALKLAERLKDNDAAQGDDLDVPAFLRNGSKEIPL